MQKKRKLLRMIFLLLLCVQIALPASALSTVNWTKTGSVSFALKDGETALADAEITLYKVADAVDQNSNLHFVFTDAFADCGETPEQLRNTAAIQRLADYAAKKNIGGQTLRTDKNGLLRFDGLSLGLYLAVQTGSVAGYSDCSPFLAAVPAESNNEWIYDVEAIPKTDPVKLVDLTVKKVWNDGGKNRPESVSVQLLNGDTVVDTVTLNEQNGWSHTWSSQPEGDAWSVCETDVPKGYTPTYQKSGTVFTVTNTSTLIQTGQLKWPIPLLAGAGLILFAAGWILYYKGKRKTDA